MGETFGEASRRLRQQAGLSQPELALRVPVSQSSVSRYESGLQAVDEVTACRLEEILGAPGELIPLLEGLDVGPLDTDERERIAYSMRFPGRIDAATITALGKSLAAQRRLDDVIGPVPLIPASLAQTAMVTRLLHEVDGPHRTELIKVGSEHVQFAGWLHAEARRDAEAVRLLTDAEDLADEADDGTLAAQAANFKGYLARQQDRPRAMVRWFMNAFHAPGAHVSQRIGDAIQVAQGYARLNERDRALNWLDIATGMLAKAAREEPPDTAYWLTPTYHLLNFGLAHLALGDYANAVDHLRTGLENLPVDQRAAEWTNEHREALERANSAR